MSDDAPSADDVERANDAVYAAAHAKAVRRACTETDAPVCECGLFAGSKPHDASQVVVSHAPVEASGLLRCFRGVLLLFSVLYGARGAPKRDP